MDRLRGEVSLEELNPDQAACPEYNEGARLLKKTGAAMKVISTDCQSHKPVVGFIGFGEVSYYIAKGLKKDGINEIHIYSRSSTDPEIIKNKQKKSEEIGAQLTNCFSDLIEHSDIIFSSVRGHVSLETAKHAAEYIRKGQLYADLNNAIPCIKRESSVFIHSKGAKFVDIGLLELPIQVENKALMYASGEGAPEFANLMIPYGMNIKVIPGEVGQSAAIKAIANIFMKGLQGVCLEFAISAKKAGISLDILEPLLVKPVLHLPREKDVALWIIRGALLAERKKEEMNEALKMLYDLGIDPIMLKAAVERLNRVSQFKLNNHFDAGMDCSDYEEIIDRMFEIGSENNINIR